MAIISQREAQRLRRRVKELELQLTNQRKHWMDEWPGVFLCSIEGDEVACAYINAAKRLGHAAIAHLSSDGKRILIYGDPYPKL